MAYESVGNASEFIGSAELTVPDIIVGYTVSWGENDGLLGGFENLQAYLDRLHGREHCTFRQPG